MRILLLAVLASLLVLSPAASEAQNLLLGADFDSVDDLAEWDDTSQTITMAFDDSRDVDGLQPASGSVLVTSNAVQEGPGINQCQPLTAGTFYELSGWVFNESADGEPGLAISFFASPGCLNWIGETDPGNGQVNTPSTLVLSTWDEVAAQFVAPATTQSARVFAQPRRVSGTSATANFDALFLPEPDGLSVVALAALALVARRRIRESR